MRKYENSALFEVLLMILSNFLGYQTEFWISFHIFLFDVDYFCEWISRFAICFAEKNIYLFFVISLLDFYFFVFILDVDHHSWTWFWFFFSFFFLAKKSPDFLLGSYENFLLFFLKQERHVIWVLYFIVTEADLLIFFFSFEQAFFCLLKRVFEDEPVLLSEERLWRTRGEVWLVLLLWSEGVCCLPEASPCWNFV